MAIRLQQKRDLSRIEFVAEADDALDHAKSDYEAYLQDGEDKHLTFKPDCVPTRFILNFELKGKDAERVKNAALSGRDSEGKATVAFGTLSFTLVKLALKEVLNPPDLGLEAAIVLRKDDRGNVHDETLALLDRLGIVAGIWSLYASLVMSPVRTEAKNS